MSSALIAEVAGSSINFSVGNRVKEFTVPFYFHTDNKNDSSLMHIIIKSVLFRDYLYLYTQTSSLLLNNIYFKSINMVNQQIESIKITVDTTDKNGNVLKNYDVNLVGHSIYVLILMRLTETPKDLCVLFKCSRPNVAKQDFLELPRGEFDENDNFVGAAADMINEQLEIQINKSNLVNLTDLAFGQESNGISINYNTDERYSLYLYRCNIYANKVHDYEDKTSSITNITANYMQIKLIPLGNAWRSTTDCKVINAIFLVHELRYHKLMPKLIISDNDYNTKKSAKFLKTTGIEPTSAGINLRVKVAGNVEFIIPEKTRKDGKEGIMLVGDEEGVIKLKLNPEQADMRFIIGMPLIIRNGKIEMENGHMILYVDRWGKLEPANESNDGYNFKVLESNNVSSIEFELVLLKNGDGDNNNADEKINDNNNNNNNNQSRGSDRKHEYNSDSRMPNRWKNYGSSRDGGRNSRNGNNSMGSGGSGGGGGGGGNMRRNVQGMPGRRSPRQST